MLFDDIVIKAPVGCAATEALVCVVVVPCARVRL